MKNQRAITLVALIITIIVLLILATVSINLVMNGGVLDKAKSSVDKYSEEEIKEKIRLAYLELETEKIYNANLDEEEFLKTRLNGTFGEENYELSIAREGYLIAIGNKKYLIDKGGKVEEYHYYVTDGLILHLDGIENTRNGHSTTTTTWEDISGNSNDFVKLDGASNAEWSDNSFVGDEKNRTLVLNSAILSSANECTVEVCYDVPQLKDYYWVFQNRQISNANGNGFQFNVVANARDINTFSGSTNRHTLSSFENIMDLNKKTMAFAIDSSNITFSNNSKFYNEPIKEGVMSSIKSSNCYSIGSAYPWQRAEFACFAGNIYSIRVYNRKLSEEELRNNYKVDRLRFNMD